VLHEQAVLETVISVREALQWQLDIATADPNEVVRVVARCCRNCYGVGHRYQWRDDEEFVAACVKSVENADENVPSDTGGYGYNGALEPCPTCPHCYGIGHEQTIIADTTKLTGKARKLYAGAEQDRFGAIKVKLHDQAAAWERVCRMLGAFNDKLDLRSPEERAKAEAKTKLPDNVTAETAAKAYLALLGG
jgi:phage terminase small subunit